MRGSVGVWDQFEANEQKFGVRTTFDENQYTTPVPQDLTAKQRQDAARLAKGEGPRRGIGPAGGGAPDGPFHCWLAEMEKEKGNTTNIHVAEERGMYVGDFDEEDRWVSCCQRKST
jgi:PAB1-binding protein PBP1